MCIKAWQAIRRLAIDGDALQVIKRDLAARGGEDESGGTPLLLADAADLVLGGVVAVDPGTDLDEDTAAAGEPGVPNAGLAALGRGVTVRGRPPAFARRQGHAG